MENQTLKLKNMLKFLSAILVFVVQTNQKLLLNERHEVKTFLKKQNVKIITQHQCQIYHDAI